MNNFCVFRGISRIPSRLFSSGKSSRRIRSSTVVDSTSNGDIPSRKVTIKKDTDVYLKGKKFKFIDRIRGEARGGDGGSGSVSFKKLKGMPSARDGGDGGEGGDVYVRAVSGMNSLEGVNLFSWNADDGGSGKSGTRSGARGKDAYVHVPVGTVVRITPIAQPGTLVKTHPYNLLNWEDFFSEGVFKIDPKQFVAKEMEFERQIELKHETMEYDLLEPNQTLMICKGGKGGLGSKSDRSITRKNELRIIKGEKGEVAAVELELKSIADVGLVGFPNAGKSSLVGAVSSTRPKVAAYPFTTLHPMIGIIRFRPKRKYFNDFTIRIADIPGIIEGAHENKGLGHAFLRHIERTAVLVYVLDIVGSEDRDPVKDFQVLQKELASYAIRGNSSLLDRPAVIFANKFDLNPELAAINAQRLTEITDLSIIVGSAKESINLEALVDKLRMIVFEYKGLEFDDIDDHLERNPELSNLAQAVAADDVDEEELDDESLDEDSIRTALKTEHVEPYSPQLNSSVDQLD